MFTETIDYKDHNIEIYTDEDPSNPCVEWDLFGTFVCWHRRYQLGHDHSFSTPDMFEDFLKAEKPPVVIPLYLYEHSALTISATPFSCPWDSGQIGWAYATRAEILGAYGGTRVSAKKRLSAQALLVNEVETYDQYLQGDVYGYVVKPQTPGEGAEEGEDAEMIDSCWGFYGCDHARSGLLEHAHAAIDHEIRQQNPLLAHAGLL